MARKYFTYQELLTTKLGDLTRIIRDAILKELGKVLGMMSDKLANRLYNTPIYQFEQWVDIYKYISIIA